MMNLDYLLKASEPWVVCRTLRDLLDKPESHASVIKAREDMISHPLVVQLLTELQLWPGKVLNSHKSAGQLYHKLGFALDLGICLSDDNIRSVTDKMTKKPVGRRFTAAAFTYFCSTWRIWAGPVGLGAL